MTEDSLAATKICKNCERAIRLGAATCPYCGEDPAKRRGQLTVWHILCVILIFFLAIAYGNYENDKPHQNPDAADRADARPAPPAPKTYTEDDFPWEADNDTSIDPSALRVKDKAVVLEGVNRIVRENKNCPLIAPGEVIVDTDKSTKTNRVYEAVCDDSNGITGGFDFSKKDLDSGRSFAALPPMSVKDAGERCEEYVRGHVPHPQLVDFSYSNIDLKSHVDGSANVSSTFAYTNDYGVTLTYRVGCDFDTSQEITHGKIWEANHQQGAYFGSFTSWPKVPGQ